MKYITTKKHLEINPNHSIIKSLKNKTKTNKNNKSIKNLIILLFKTSLLTSNFNLKKPKTHANRIHKIIKLNLDKHIKFQIHYFYNFKFHILINYNIKKKN